MHCGPLKMADLHSPELHLSREKGITEGQSTSSYQHAVARDPVKENVGPPPTSRVFEGMLRTRTETGDIGIFSIKPSRISRPLSGPRRIYHPSQPLFRHFKTRADRRNLPSYTQDVSSEILSTYDTTSQRAVSQYSATQGTNHPPCRSYSATYLSSSVSNLRSYAIITNQTGWNDPSQRPRPPFASTSRVTRPPRPRFPVLVNGDDTGNFPSSKAKRLIYVSICIMGLLPRVLRMVLLISDS